MSAVFSADGTQRYVLARTVRTTGPVYGYFGVNPSTADGVRNDPTVKKLMGLTWQLGGGRFLLGNVVSQVATNVRALGTYDPHRDHLRGKHWEHIEAIIKEADVLVPMWGARAKLPPHLRPLMNALADILLSSGKPVKCFGLTGKGDPCHPLYLPYDTKLIDYPRS